MWDSDQYDRDLEVVECSDWCSEEPDRYGAYDEPELEWDIEVERMGREWLDNSWD